MCTMWGSSVSRETLLQKITLLAMLGPLRVPPKEYTLTSPPDSERRLSIAQEADIVRNLSFLSSRRKDALVVIAVCVEEVERGKGLIVRMAVSGGGNKYTKDGLRQICTILEQVSRCGKRPGQRVIRRMLIWHLEENTEQDDIDLL